MSEIKVGSRVRSLVEGGRSEGLKGEVLSLQNGNVSVQLDGWCSYTVFDPEQLEVIDPAPMNVSTPLWVPLAHKDVFDHRWPIRVLTLDGHLIVEGRSGSASKSGDTLTFVEIVCRWSRRYFSFEDKDMADVRFEQKNTSDPINL